MKKSFLSVSGIMILTGCFSCNRSIEPLPGLVSPLRRVAFVFQKEADFYSACALLEDQKDKAIWQPVPLFDKSSTGITYLLNTKSTQDRKAVRAVFRKHQISEIFFGEAEPNGRNVFVIKYQE